MDLAIPFAVVIASTLGLVGFAMYRGGGRNAVRRQTALLIALGAVLTGYAVLLLAVADGNTLLAIGTVTAAVAAAVAVSLAISLSRRQIAGPVVVLSWIAAAILTAVAIGALLLFVQAA